MAMMKATVYPTGNVQALLGSTPDAVKNETCACLAPVVEQHDRLARGIDTLINSVCELEDRLACVCSAAVTGGKNEGGKVTFSSVLAMSLMDKADRVYQLVDRINDLKSRLEV